MWQHNRKRIADIQILNVVVTVHLHTGRNRNGLAKHFIDIKIFYMVKLLYLLGIEAPEAMLKA